MRHTIDKSPVLPSPKARPARGGQLDTGVSLGTIAVHISADPFVLDCRASRLRSTHGGCTLMLPPEVLSLNPAFSKCRFISAMPPLCEQQERSFRNVQGGWGTHAA